MKEVLANLLMLFPGRTPSELVTRWLDWERKETLQELLIYDSDEPEVHKVWAIYQRTPIYIGSFFRVRVTADKILMEGLER